jgi:hypothetical protein
VDGGASGGDHRRAAGATKTKTHTGKSDGDGSDGKNAHGDEEVFAMDEEEGLGR